MATCIKCRAAAAPRLNPYTLTVKTLITFPLYLALNASAPLMHPFVTLAAIPRSPTPSPPPRAGSPKVSLSVLESTVPIPSIYHET